jgi:hypothetical protein
MAVTPTQPTSSMAALYHLETSYQILEQQYQSLKTRLNLACETNDTENCAKAAELNAKLQALLSNMASTLEANPDKEAETQQLRLERKAAALKNEYATFHASLDDSEVLANMFQARYLCFTFGFLFVVGLCLKTISSPE